MTEISSVSVHRRIACVYSSAWNTPSFKNVKRFIDARLHAVSSKNIYSEQGFDPRISPSSGQVCHALIVSWNWIPGSAQAHAAWPTSSHKSRALIVLATLPSVRLVRCQSASSSTALRNASVTRIELLEFCPETDAYASESQSVS